MGLLEFKPNEWINVGLIDRVEYTRENKVTATNLLEPFMPGTTHTETIHTLKLHLSRAVESTPSPVKANDPEEITRIAKILGIRDPIESSSP
jgi:hypothetical protein